MSITFGSIELEIVGKFLQNCSFFDSFLEYNLNAKGEEDEEEDDGGGKMSPSWAIPKLFIS